MIEVARVLCAKCCAVLCAKAFSNLNTSFTLTFVLSNARDTRHLINTILAVSEVPQHAYNPDVAAQRWDNARFPSAVDAGRIAALLCRRDLDACAASTEPPAEAVDTDHDLEGTTDDIMTPVGDALPGDNTRRVYNAKNEFVVHELPSGPPREGACGGNYIFDETGYLNPSFKDVGASLEPQPYVDPPPFVNSDAGVNIPLRCLRPLLWCD